MKNIYSIGQEVVVNNNFTGMIIEASIKKHGVTYRVQKTTGDGYTTIWAEDWEITSKVKEMTLVRECLYNESNLDIPPEVEAPDIITTSDVISDIVLSVDVSELVLALDAPNSGYETNNSGIANKLKVILDILKKPSDEQLGVKEVINTLIDDPLLIDKYFI